MSSVKIYFVLYIVLLCEIFIVLLDRDEAIDENEQYLIKGRGLDFNLVAPANKINFTIFIDPFKKATSDYIQKVILPQTFIKSDSDFVSLDSSYWVKRPKLLFSLIPEDSLQFYVKREDSAKSNIILTIFCSYKGTGFDALGDFKFKSDYDRGTIGVKCKIQREVGSTAQMRFSTEEINWKKYVEIPDTTVIDKNYGAFVRREVEARDNDTTYRYYTKDDEFIREEKIIDTEKEVKRYLKIVTDKENKKYVILYGYAEINVIFNIKKVGLP